MAEPIWQALAQVMDPEMPVVSVVDLGMVSAVRTSGERVEIDLMPTFVGCPALDIIRRAVTEQVEQVVGGARVEVCFVLAPPWTSDRITAAGRAKLQTFGIAPPGQPDGIQLLAAPPCPYCSSPETHLENVFGPTACRAVFYCSACRNPFEAIKSL